MRGFKLLGLTLIASGLASLPCLAQETDEATQATTAPAQAATAPAEQPKIEPLGPEENGKQLVREALSDDALVSLFGIEGLRKQNMLWSLEVQVALISAIGPGDDEDPNYLRVQNHHDDQMARLYAVRAMTNLMRTESRQNLVLDENVQQAVKDGQADTIASDELRRALIRRLDRILDPEDAKYANYETRGWAVELLGMLRNSSTDKEVELDVLYNILMARYLAEPSYHVRTYMLAVFKDPNYLKADPGPEQFLCERIADREIEDRERAMALGYLIAREPHADLVDLRRKTLIDASQFADIQMRSLAVQGLGKLKDDQAALDQLKAVLLTDSSVYVRMLAGDIIAKREDGKTLLTSWMPEISSSLTNPEGAVFSPKLFEKLQDWAKQAEEEKTPAAQPMPEGEADQDKPAS